MKRLTKTEARAFAFMLGQEKVAPSISELAAKLEMRKGNLSRSIRQLEKTGLIRIFREGRKHRINVQDYHRFLFMEMRKGFPVLKAENLLAGDMPFLLSHLERYTKKDRGEYSDASVGFTIGKIDLPESSTKRMLGRLKIMGIIYKVSKREYRVRIEAHPVLEFCKAICTGMCLQAAEEELGGVEDFMVSFESVKNPEVIAVTTAKKDLLRGYWPTAYSALDGYGIKLISSGKYYYTNVKPDICRIIIHILAIGRDPRSIMYAAALMHKNRFEYGRLLEQKTLFGTYLNFIKKMIRFVESGGTEGGGLPFPAWEEVVGV